VVVALFALTLFGSAFLLFVLEPMVAKALLPKLGGTPMVWNTCMVFFQTMLLAGYAAAHLTSAGRSLRCSIWVYVVLLLVGTIALPLSFALIPETSAHPVIRLLVELGRIAGLPVLALSMSAPVLQASFAQTGLPRARDPYFLYAASNAGSLLALLLYPTLIEPRLGLHRQVTVWAAIYVIVAGAAGACMFVARQRSLVSDDTPAARGPGRSPSGTSGRQRLRWIVLAFIPSSLMLGVTTHLSTDVASVPLIWIIPLSLYLASFIIAFGRASKVATRLAERFVPLLAVAIVFPMSAGISMDLVLNIPLHLTMFTAVALMCHGRLAGDRPPGERLTEFYLLLSVGGVAGGLFNTLLGPVLFTSVAEYPIVLILACAIPALRWHDTAGDLRRDLAFAVGAGGLIAAINLGAMQSSVSLVRAGYIGAGAVAVTTFTQSRQSIRFALMLAAILLAAQFANADYGTVIHAERTFFGTYRVSQDATGQFQMLTHGSTLHGMEFNAPGRRLEPLAYYHRNGPFGQAFERLPVMHSADTAAVVGLGIGALASYSSAKPIHWTFYEIDPAVERLARDTRYFGFLDACGARCRVVLGDARLSLAQSDAMFDFIVLDAFSSDSIPLHLVTRDALDVYLRHLRPPGVLLFHISNRYLALENVLARIANDRGLSALVQRQRVGPSALANGQWGSIWLVVSADRRALAPLSADSRWNFVVPPSDTPLWTDDFSNIVAALRVRAF
jgi:hypothetical protein